MENVTIMEEYIQELKNSPLQAKFDADLVELSQKIEELRAFDVAVGANDVVTSITETYTIIENIKSSITTLISESEEKLSVLNSADYIENVQALSDFIVFKTEVYETIDRLIAYFDGTGFRSKLALMQDTISTADTKIEEMVAVVATVSSVSEAVVRLDQSIDEAKELNAEQQQLIDVNSRMVASVEKQIEDYVFFSETFDELYRQARIYVKDIATLTNRTVAVEERVNAVLEEIQDEMPAFIVSFEEMKQYISTLSERLATDAKLGQFVLTEALGEIVMADSIRKTVVGSVIIEMEDNTSRLATLRNSL